MAALSDRIRIADLRDEAEGRATFGALVDLAKAAHALQEDMAADTRTRFFSQREVAFHRALDRFDFEEQR